MDKAIIYVGLDVHKDTIAVALAEAGARSECASMARSRTRRRLLKALARSWRGSGTRYGSAMRPDLAAMAFNAS